MSLESVTPWEKEVIATFTVHLGRFLSATTVQGEAATYRESPQFAAYTQPLIDATREASPEEVAETWAAVLPAVVATVRDFASSNPPPETE